MRIYTEEAKLQKLQDDASRSKMRLNLSLYDFNITLKDLEELLKVSEKTIEIAITVEHGYRTYGNLRLLRVQKLITNARGTLKLCILSNGEFLLFNKNTKPMDFGYFSVDYDLKHCNLFDDIKDTMYVVLVKDWNDNWKLGALTDAFTPKQAAKWEILYTNLIGLRKDNSQYNEVENLPKSKLEGEITIGRLETEIALVENTLVEVQKLEAEEQVKKAKAHAAIIKTPTRLEFNALDNHTYSIEVHANKQWDMITWERFFYRHRYLWNSYEEEHAKRDTFFNNIMEIVERLPNDWVKVSIDGKKPVKLSFKKAKLQRGGEMKLSYIDEKRVANDSMMNALRDYFYNNKPLAPDEVPEDVEEEKRDSLKKIQEARDTLVVTQGIKGYLQDLEGECPINIAFEKEGVQWMLTIGELKIHLKGGVGTIQSIERVLKGTAQGYDSRHSTEEFYNRLCKVLPQEDAMKIIKTAKEMGKLVQNLQTGDGKTTP